MHFLANRFVLETFERSEPFSFVRNAFAIHHPSREPGRSVRERVLRKTLLTYLWHPQVNALHNECCWLYTFTGMEIDPGWRQGKNKTNSDHSSQESEHSKFKWILWRCLSAFTTLLPDKGGLNNRTPVWSKDLCRSNNIFYNYLQIHTDQARSSNLYSVINNQPDGLWIHVIIELSCQ